MIVTSEPVHHSGQLLAVGRQRGERERPGRRAVDSNYPVQHHVQNHSTTGLSGYLVCRPMGDRAARSQGFTLWAGEK